MPKITVIVPIYSSEKFLNKCIDSILQQTFKDMEIILVNDGSKDRSYEIIEAYKEQDTRIIAVHRENGGQDSARNVGIELAKGKYIYFVDSDDWIEEDMLERMYNTLEEQNADLAVCNYNKVYVDKDIRDKLKLRDECVEIDKLGIENYFYKYFFPYLHGHEVWNKLYKREIIANHNIIFEKANEVFSEDLLFNLYYLCHINKICSINSPFYNYMQHDASIMNNQKPNLTSRYTELIQRYTYYVQKINIYDKLKKVIPIMLYRLLSNGLFAEYSISNNLYNMEKGLFKASKSPSFKSYMKELAFGNAVSVFRRKIGWTGEAELRCRLFSLYCYLGLYRFAAKQKYKRYMNS